jgi:RNA polymerase sigma-70 factor, ECF subfamily
MGSDGAVYFPGTPGGQADLASEPYSNAFESVRSGKSSSVNGPLDSSTDEDLLTEVARGSKDALALLFRRHRQAVLNIASRILRDISEAEDLCQEVFIYLFEKAKLFDAGKGTASSWIIQIAYHRAMNRRQYLAFRQHYSAQELDEEQLGSDPQRPFVDEVVARTLLNRFRERLSAEQQQTLELHFFEGYSFREIAEQTGQTFGNIRHHYYRGLERLRSLVFPREGA